MATDSTGTDPTPRDRIEQAYRFVERMREPDIVTPDEERRLRHLFSLIEAEGRQEAVRLLRDILHAQNDGEMERAMKAAREWMKTQPVVAGLNASESRYDDEPFKAWIGTADEMRHDR